VAQLETARQLAMDLLDLDGLIQSINWGIGSTSANQGCGASDGVGFSIQSNAE
jgi:hypothetical protein